MKRDLKNDIKKIFLQLIKSPRSISPIKSPRSISPIKSLALPINLVVGIFFSFLIVGRKNELVESSLEKIIIFYYFYYLIINYCHFFLYGCYTDCSTSAYTVISIYFGPLIFDVFSSCSKFFYELMITLNMLFMNYTCLSPIASRYYPF